MIYVVPARVSWVLMENSDRSDPDLYLMRVPDGEPVLLSGTAALIWVLAAEGEDALGGLADMVDLSVDDIAEGTVAFLTVLVARGLLDVFSDT